jgi:hypothetical protein
MARNEIVAYARQEKFDELLFWDKDVLAEEHGVNVTANAMMRLLGHDVDIVCAPVQQPPSGNPLAHPHH